jgi:raffinose/stachyose/melibiose transport system substrate-binding protein
MKNTPMLGILSMLMLMPLARAGTLSMESWRAEDTIEWNQQILPEFKKLHPDIDISFTPTTDNYDKALALRLRNGNAGDLISCRPFEEKLFDNGYVHDLTGIEGLRNYRSVAKLAWTTEDGLHLFCLPVASVMHGFFYNQKIFKQLGLSVPETEAQFFEVLEKLKKNKKIVPIAFGTKDGWASHQLVFTNIGPNYWAGEQGRIALLEGKQKFTDAPYINTWKTMARWAPFLPKNHKTVGHLKARDMFVKGEAAIYPSGSWDIAYLNEHSKQEIGVFRPPVVKKEDECHFTNHIDIGIGINTASTNKADADVFLHWLTGRQFANVLANTLPGYFPLSSHLVEITDPLAREMVSWRRVCETTIRINSYVFNSGSSPIEEEFWNVDALVMNGKLKPDKAGEKIQSSLDKWFKPLQ